MLCTLSTAHAPCLEVILSTSGHPVSALRIFVWYFLISSLQTKPISRLMVVIETWLVRFAKFFLVRADIVFQMALGLLSLGRHLIDEFDQILPLYSRLNLVEVAVLVLALYAVPTINSFSKELTLLVALHPPKFCSILGVCHFLNDLRQNCLLLLDRNLQRLWVHKAILGRWVCTWFYFLVSC